MKKKIPFQDTFLTLRNYKEPLIEIKDGFGYYGALLGTSDNKKVQCHICGELFLSVGVHARQEHKISLSDYRERFQLAKKTALISEDFRQQLKQRSINYFASLTKKQRQAIKQKAIAGLKLWRKLNPDKIGQQFKIQLETKNKRGTCPQQLLEKIKVVEKELGYFPSLLKFCKHLDTQRYKHLIIATFGSWNNAVKLLGKEPIENNRLNYTDDQLLESLRMYKISNRKAPTTSDIKRGLLPAASTYRRRFGSFTIAKEIAGVL